DWGWIVGCVMWLAVDSCVCWVLEFAVSSNVGSAFLALECFVPGYVRVCFAGWVVCDTVESAIGARPGATRPHAQVWPILNVWAKSVKYGLSRLNVPLIIPLDGLLCFGITVNGGFCDIGAVLVCLRNNAETLSQRVEGV